MGIVVSGIYGGLEDLYMLLRQPSPCESLRINSSVLPENMDPQITSI